MKQSAPTPIPIPIPTPTCIPISTPIPDTAPIPVYQLHPLLFLSKQKIIQYMIENDYHWVEDSSNYSLDYKRNKVRKQLIPLLIELCGSEDAVSK